jgi:tetratricopeptide (TPR) repeat protein
MEVLARSQAEANSRERVLDELGVIAKRMRTTLGESLPSIQRFDVSIDQATTPSLAALKAYTLGLAERRRGRELESVAFFNQAIELDRQFASAYATLSTVYGSLGEWRQSEEYATRAYALRDRVSERERMFITYQYHDRVTGDIDLAVSALERWKVAYPRDARPANALALAHNRTGDYERAATEAQEALRRSPGHPFPLSNLAYAYRGMGRYSEARRVAEEAVRLGVETSPTRRLLYQLGILADDGSAAVHIAWAGDRPQEFDIVAAQAEVAAFEGRLQAAADLYDRASDIAVNRGLAGTAFGYLTRLAWAEALFSDGLQPAEGVKRLMANVDTERGGAASVLRFRAGTALGLAGLTADAQLLVNRAEQRYPQGTFVRTVLGPSIRAAVALRLRQPDAAIDALRAAIPTELGTVAGLVPTYLRGEALLQKGQLEGAVGEYDRILLHRGVDPFAPIVPMACLEMARARARLGDTSGSVRAYQDLLRIWRNADPGFAPLVAARAEYDRLTAASVAAGSR